MLLHTLNKCKSEIELHVFGYAAMNLSLLKLNTGNYEEQLFPALPPQLLCRFLLGPPEEEEMDPSKTLHIPQEQLELPVSGILPRLLEQGPRLKTKLTLVKQLKGSS